jgi:hypothetical protein
MPSDLADEDLDSFLCLIDANELFSKLAVVHGSRSFTQRVSGKLLAASVAVFTLQPHNINVMLAGQPITQQLGE